MIPQRLMQRTAFWFWAMLTGYRDDLTIDRIDWRKGYCHENCRWATRAEQNRNRHWSRRKTSRSHFATSPV